VDAVFCLFIADTARLLAMLTHSENIQNQGIVPLPPGMPPVDDVSYGEPKSVSLLLSYVILIFSHLKVQFCLFFFF